jgi:hypothetical protein
VNKAIDTNFSMVKYSGEGKIDSLDGSSIRGQLVKLKIENLFKKLMKLCISDSEAFH